MGAVTEGGLTRVQLGVLDLAPVPEGLTPAQALRNSVDLAAHVERQGYHRYWAAEHHNRPGIASSSPAVLLAHVAGATSTIRLGSGGVMLPNHAPLVIAEQFGMLEALNPGRVDLGVGRAVGSDEVTARALRSDGQTLERFAALITELLELFTGSPSLNGSSAVVATPGLGLLPEIWILGSSLASARLAAELGLPFSFAHHFNPATTTEAVELYRAMFTPSRFARAPRVMVAVMVICGDDDKHARWLAGPLNLAFVRAAHGIPGPLPTPEEAAAYSYAPDEEAVVQARMESQAVGSPTEVRRRLDALATTTNADELMLVTTVHGHSDRVRSYGLISDAVGLLARATRLDGIEG